MQYSHSLKESQMIAQIIIYLQFIKSMTTCMKLMLVLTNANACSEELLV